MDANTTKNHKDMDRKDMVSQVRGLLMRQPLIDMLTSIAPKHLDATRLAAVCVAAVSQNDTLLQCTRPSLVRSLIDSALCGLEIGVMGQAYLVPRWNDRHKSNEATMLPGYQGLCMLARQSGTVDDISATLVYAADEFYFVSGTETKLRHIPNFAAENEDQQGELILAYMIARLPNGIIHPHIMTRSKINKIKAFALAKIKNKSYSPWLLHEEEMQKKTVIRQGLKILSSNPSAVAPLARALVLHDSAETNTAAPQPSELEIGSQISDAISELDGDLYYSTDDIDQDGEIMTPPTRTEQLKTAQQKGRAA